MMTSTHRFQLGDMVIFNANWCKYCNKCSNLNHGVPFRVVCISTGTDSDDHLQIEGKYIDVSTPLDIWFGHDCFTLEN